ncbi:MAG: transporter [Prosthecobacter sp.]|uniref:SphA family protein n=1 Tax=Prosthecobacter sp. TaxID=1965333 RepID=UPI0038FEB577
MNRILRRLLPVLCILLTTAAQAQSHYPTGVEGIKGGSLPPPGLYLKDYNFFYAANKFTGGPPGFNVSTYVQVPRLVWISEFKILGGNYGADILIPYVYQDISFAGFRGSHAGFGDVFFEPISLSWHTKQLDFGVAYGLWMPTGAFNAANPVSPGKGYYTNMFTVGGTWFPDDKKTWSVSVLNRYEINDSQRGTGIRPGQVYTIEYGIAKALTPVLECGVVGYWQRQTTFDTGPAAPRVRDGVAALGMEVTYAFPKIMLFTSLRYLHEFNATNRPQGDVINLTLTKRF